jgi:DNA-binding SARP family transcriptional activator
MATPDISLRVLGPLQVCVDGDEIPVLANQQRVILACLVTAAGQPVRFSGLIEKLWGSNPPTGARNAMQTYVGRLRRLLPEGTIRTGPGAYWIDSVRTDLEEFRHLTALAREAQAAPGTAPGTAPDTAPDTAVGLWRQAMALWRGPVLSNVESGPLHASEGAWLTELLLAAAEQRFDAELHLGNYAEIAPELTALASEYPLFERLRAQLMRALHGAGRPAEALAVFRETARMLRSELGVEPGAELRALNQEILAGTGSPRTANTPQLWRIATQLPAAVNLIGRDTEQARIARLLKEDKTVPVVMISGPPGVGKTALAIAVAHGLRADFPDGQLFARMQDGLGRPRDTAEVLAELLEGTGAERVPHGLEARAAALRTRLADHRVLIVVDDALDAAQIRLLVPGVPGSAVLVTSRRLLTGAESPTLIRLGPLTPQDSAKLLAQAAGPGRTPIDPAAAHAIGAACGGLPLAVRIAGARLSRDPELEPADLAARLSDRRRVLGELDVAECSVRAGMELAYQSLSESARTAFRRIALLCRSGISRWALEAAEDAGQSGDATSSIEALLEVNLIQPTGRDAVGQARYRAHQLAFAYAVQLAEESAADTKDAVKRLLAALTVRAAEAFHAMPWSCDDLPPSVDRRPPRSAPATGALFGPLDPVAWLQACSDLVADIAVQSAGTGLPTEAALLADYAVPVLSRLDSLDPARRVRLAVRDAATAARQDLIAWRQRFGLCVLDMRADQYGRARDELRLCVEAFEALSAHDELVRALALLADVEARTVVADGQNSSRQDPREHVTRRVGDYAFLKA